MNKEMWDHIKRLDREEPIQWERVRSSQKWFVFIGILIILAIVLADSDFIGLVKSWM